jgi:hypothetical protein
MRAENVSGVDFADYGFSDHRVTDGGDLGPPSPGHSAPGSLGIHVSLPAGVREAHVAAPRGLRDGPLQVWFVDGVGPEPRTFTTQISFAPLDAVTSRLP